jgi:hypothetical protein
MGKRGPEKQFTGEVKAGVSGETAAVVRRLAHLENDSVASVVRAALDRYISERRKELQRA